MAAPSNLTPSNAGFIYVLKPQALIDGREVIKIGMTTRSVAERVRELTTGSLVQLDVAYSIHVDDARKVEKHLHELYRAYRLLGGGQEFFSVSAEKVIAELDRMAIKISRTRARDARNAEMDAFMNEIGASRSKKMLHLPFMLLIFGGWFGGLILLFNPVRSYFGDGYAGPVMFALLFVWPLLWTTLLGQLRKLLDRSYFDTRFGAQITKKHDELRVKYPLAYH